MAADSPRIIELRRRVQADPSSIAFAQLAEEHRRAGDHNEAIRLCRAGLQHHPGYLSARVTLGRAMMEIGQLEDAELEFDFVLGTAPDNLAAIRGMAEINQRQGNLQLALGYYQAALGLARHDLDLEETVAKISRVLADAAGEKAPGMSFDQAMAELSSAADRMPLSTNVDPQEVVVVEPSVPPDSQEADGGPLKESQPSGATAAALVDFDEILENLGEPPSTSAPPQVEAWLAAAPLAVVPDSSSPNREPLQGAEVPLDDVLGHIEEDLRRGEANSSAPGDEVKVESTAPAHDPTEQATLEELERWLEVLEDAREHSR